MGGRGAGWGLRETILPGERLGATEQEREGRGEDESDCETETEREKKRTHARVIGSNGARQIASARARESIANTMGPAPRHNGLTSVRARAPACARVRH